ncbi:hypothetical protein ES702_02671 [subsurface metagenome]
MSYTTTENNITTKRLSQPLGSYRKEFTCDKIPYLERVAKTYNFSESSFDSYCAQYTKVGQCEEEYQFLVKKRMYNRGKMKITIFAPAPSDKTLSYEPYMPFSGGKTRIIMTLKRDVLKSLI